MFTDKHKGGYVDQIGPECSFARGQKSYQTRIWPGTAEPETLDGLVLSGLSYTPRSLILKFGRLDLQVCYLLAQPTYYLTNLTNADCMVDTLITTILWPRPMEGFYACPQED